MNLPNKITLTRIVLIPVFLALFLSKEHGDVLLYAAVGVFLVAGATDWLDGYIARSRNLVTDMGKFLDPIADKILVSSGLFLILGFELIPAVWGVVFVTLIIAREFIVSALRLIAAAKNTVIAADKVGKAKTFVTLIAIAVVLLAAPLDALLADGTGAGAGFAAFGAFGWAGFALLSVAAALTAVSGVNYVVKNRRVFAES